MSTYKKYWGSSWYIVVMAYRGGGVYVGDRYSVTSITYNNMVRIVESSMLVLLGIR